MKTTTEDMGRRYEISFARRSAVRVCGPAGPKPGAAGLEDPEDDDEPVESPNTVHIPANIIKMRKATSPHFNKGDFLGAVAGSSSSSGSPIETSSPVSGSADGWSGKPCLGCSGEYCICG